MRYLIWHRWIYEICANVQAGNESFICDSFYYMNYNKFMNKLQISQIKVPKKKKNKLNLSMN